MLTRSRRKELLDNGACESDLHLYTLEHHVKVRSKMTEFSVFETIAVFLCVLFLLLVFVKTDWVIRLYQHDYNYRIFRKAWI